MTPIATASNTPETAITVGAGPYSIAITPNGKTAYVVNHGGNTVTPIDHGHQHPRDADQRGKWSHRDRHHPERQDRLRHQRRRQHRYSHRHGHQHPRRRRLPVESGPLGIAITPNGQTAYVANWWQRHRDPDRHGHQHSRDGDPRVGGSPTAIAITPDGKTTYVTDGSGTTVTPIATATNTPETAISVGANSRGHRHHPRPGPDGRLHRHAGISGITHHLRRLGVVFAGGGHRLLRLELR